MCPTMSAFSSGRDLKPPIVVLFVTFQDIVHWPTASQWPVSDSVLEGDNVNVRDCT